MAKRIGIVLISYIALVVVFESMMGIFQPAGGNTLVITTVDEDGGSKDRVLAHLQTEGKSYVAVNHWPRDWYERALANPDVEITIEGETKPYTAVPVDDAEFARVDGEHSRGGVFLFLTGFPPREILRLDPR